MPFELRGELKAAMKVASLLLGKTVSLPQLSRTNTNNFQLPGREVVLRVTDKPFAAVSISPVEKAGGEAPTIFHCCLPKEHWITREVDAAAVEAEAVEALSRGIMEEIGTFNEWAERGGRPQPKRDEPETITVTIPVDIAERWLHGADEPEIQSLVEDALERR